MPIFEELYMYMSTRTFLYLRQFKRTTCIYYDEDPLVIDTRKKNLYMNNLVHFSTSVLFQACSPSLELGRLFITKTNHFDKEIYLYSTEMYW